MKMVSSIELYSNARLEVLTAVLLKIQAFWNVTQCRIVNNYRCSEGM
jgi:hypothetical protein